MKRREENSLAFGVGREGKAIETLEVIAVLDNGIFEPLLSACVRKIMVCYCLYYYYFFKKNK
jgi:hypothetical protein